MAPPRTKKTAYFVGVVRKYIEENFQLPADKAPDYFLNGHVYLLFIQNGKSPTKTGKQLRELYGLESTPCRIISLVQKSKNWSRNFSRPYDRQRFEDFSKKPYVCTISARPSKKRHLQQPQEDKLLILPESEPASAATIELNSTDAICANTCEDLPRSSREKLTAREIKLKKRLSYLSTQIANSSKKYKDKIAVLRSKLKNMPQKIKVLNQKVRRKTVTIKALRKTIHQLKKNENRKKIKSLKEKKYSSDWKIKHSDQMNSNVIVITNTEKNNHLDEGHQPQINEEIYSD